MQHVWDLPAEQSVLPTLYSFPERLSNILEKWLNMSGVFAFKSRPRPIWCHSLETTARNDQLLKTSSLLQLKTFPIGRFLTNTKYINYKHEIV